jgi:hypothetical protein
METRRWDDHHGHKTDQEAPPKIYQPISKQNHRIEVNHSTSPHYKETLFNNRKAHGTFEN